MRIIVRYGKRALVGYVREIYLGTAILYGVDYAGGIREYVRELHAVIASVNGNIGESAALDEEFAISYTLHP